MYSLTPSPKSSQYEWQAKPQRSKRDSLRDLFPRLDHPDISLPPPSKKRFPGYQMGELQISQTQMLPLSSGPSSPTSSNPMDIEKANGDETAWKPEKKEWFIMISLSIISFMVALDSTIMVTVLPQIAVALNGTSVDAFWAGTSYLLSSAVFQPVIASVSERFGRQQLLLFSLTFFTIGTILCAVAQDFAVMLTGRSIQGIGGGGIITLSQVIFCDIVPLRLRPTYFAIVQVAWSIGTIIGPVLGGVFVAHGGSLSWRWAFIINFPFIALGYILAALFIRLNAVAPMTLAEKLKSTDWLGAVLFVGGMTSFLIGLSWGGVQYAWDSAQTLAPVIIGLAGVAVFVGYQVYIKPKSLLPMSIFYCPSAIWTFYCSMINGLLLFSALYYIPFYCMSVRGSSPIQAGIDLFPAVFLMVPSSIVTAGLTTRLGRYRWGIWGGWTITTVGCGLFILLDLHTEYAILAVSLVVFGIGAGMALTSINVAVQAISKVEDSAMSASMYGFMRSLGMPLGVALSGTIFQNAMSSKLSSFGLPDSIAHDSERYIYILRTMALDDPKRINILTSYVHGFRYVFIAMTVLSASALTISPFIKKFDMNKTLQSKFSARK